LLAYRLKRKGIAICRFRTRVRAGLPVNRSRGCHARGDNNMNPNVKLDREALAEFCRKWRVRELSLFGSAVRDDFGPESDLDFLVSFDPGTPLDIDWLLDMKEQLETLFGRPVDLVEKEALRNPWRKYEILRTRKVIYAT